MSVIGIGCVQSCIEHDVRSILISKEGNEKNYASKQLRSKPQLSAMAPFPQHARLVPFILEQIEQIPTRYTE